MKNIEKQYQDWLEEWKDATITVDSEKQNDGIGAYEAHGVRGYDAGTDYVAGAVTREVRFSLPSTCTSPPDAGLLVGGFLSTHWEEVVDSLWDDADKPGEAEQEDLAWKATIEGYGWWTLEVTIGFTALWDGDSGRPDPLDVWKARREEEG